MFQSYEEDFLRLEGQISQRINQMKSSGSSRANDIESNDVAGMEQLINQAEATLRQLEVEARSLPNRNAIQNKLRDYRRRLSDLKSNAQPLMQSSMRDSLLGGSRGGASNLNIQTRDRMLSTTRTLQDVRFQLSYSVPFQKV